MNIPELGALTEVDVRQAWPHEALSFTPWLAEHLEALSKVIGIPLELEGREVSVAPFFADLLARNPQDGSLVLIENQLGGADHGHLGQIMTYLAGLGAQIIVWVASDFREAHLSAVKWLNDHTLEPYAFFAVKVRAVRIGDSPIAPVFEVMERPNQWERHLQQIAQGSEEVSTLGKMRKDFWTFYVERFPDEAAWGPPTAASNRRHELKEVELVVSLYLAKTNIGAFLRGPRGGSDEALLERLQLQSERLSALLQTNVGEAPYYYMSWTTADTPNESNWPQLADWLHTVASRYEKALREIFKGQV